MADVWSFNTTVRNPERIENFLRVLNEVEGEVFNEHGQEHFFSLLIKKRLYKPTKRTLSDQDLIDVVYDESNADDLPDDIVGRILVKFGGQVDAAGRGRTPAGILNRFGLCIALASHGGVTITELGKKWLNGDISDEELFTKFFLKWQYPNPLETGYPEFNIKPFIGVLKLISQVNAKWSTEGQQAVGISKEEYQLFVPSLTNARDIDSTADHLIDYRKKVRSLTGREKTDFQKQFAKQRARQIYGSSAEIRKSLANLKDYTDSSIRYFRVSGFITLRGAGHFVDIARDKAIQADSIINNFSAEAGSFATTEDYLVHLSDITVPQLPWENATEHQKIIENLTKITADEVVDQTAEVKHYASNRLSDIAQKSLKEQVVELQELVNDIRIQRLRELRYDTEKLKECIRKLEELTLRNYETVTTRPSLDFEWFTSLALMVLNDALKIDPSYALGDDGIPTGFAANKADIECMYSNFGMTVEVTLLMGRDQEHAEGQSVMRHFRDFEDKRTKESNFCIFVAPVIHRDTLNTFWNSVKHDYEGRKQKIAPLTLPQFIKLLKIACQRIESGNFDHSKLHTLLKAISDSSQKHANSLEWQSDIPNIIESWART